MELLLPTIEVPELKLPSYVKLDMAFGVGSGTSLFDKSRYRSHGTITTASWATGAHGYCLDFNSATPDYVTIPAAHTQLNFTTEDFSAVIRINSDGTTTWQTIFQIGRPLVDGYRFMVHNAGYLYFTTSQALLSQHTSTAAGSIVWGTDYTLGLSRAGASIRIYRDGVDSTTVAGVHVDPDPATAAFYISYDIPNARRPLNGRIEFLRIFGGVALQPSEHLAWHNALV